MTAQETCNQPKEGFVLLCCQRVSYVFRNNRVFVRSRMCGGSNLEKDETGRIFYALEVRQHVKKTKGTRPGQHHAHPFFGGENVPEKKGDLSLCFAAAVYLLVSYYIGMLYIYLIVCLCCSCTRQDSTTVLR